MLGSGFIARFYAESLHDHRRVDQIHMVYSRNLDHARSLAHDYHVPHFTDNMQEAVEHNEVDVVIIALPNHLHEKAVEYCAQAKKPVLCTKPLGRTGDEAFRMLKMVEDAGIFAGYLEDLCYTPKFLKAMNKVKAGDIGDVLWTKSREAHPGPHSDWFWDKEKSGGGAIIDLACHCVEISRNYIGKQIKPVEVMCWADTQVHPIEAEDHAIGLVKYANGAIGQFEVSWCFRGGMDLRDEVMGTRGSIWVNSFLRTGFEMFSLGSDKGYVAEKAELDSGWLFPVGDEAHELGYPHMFTDMFSAIEENRPPLETFYDGYVVNAILDAALQSAISKQWEPVMLAEWRGEEERDYSKQFKSYDEDHFLIKEEVLPNQDIKLILKNKHTGEMVQHTVKSK